MVKKTKAKEIDDILNNSPPKTKSRKKKKSHNAPSRSRYYTRDDIVQIYYNSCQPETYISKTSTKEFCVLMAERFKSKFPTLNDYINEVWRDLL